MKFTPDVIVTIIGMIIFIPAFTFQVYRIYKKGKHAVNFSPASWTLNFIGRYLWIAYGLFFGAKAGNEGLGLLTVIGQGLVTLMTIPILYYTYRNHRHDGQYSKQHFRRQLFAIRMTLLIFVLASMIVACLGIEGAFTVPEISKWALLAFALGCTIFTSVAFLPQTIKTIKNRNTKSTSFFLAFLFALGNTVLVLAFFLKIVNHSGSYWNIPTHLSLADACVQYIGIIILPVPTIIMMFIVSGIKLSNHIKYKEPL